MADGVAVNAKKPDAAPPATGANPSVRLGTSTFGAYSPSASALAGNPFEKERKRVNLKWEAAVQLFSRYTFGALFYALAGVYGTRWLKDYHPDKRPENGLQWIACAIDKTLGKCLQSLVGAFAGAEAGKQFVRFRPTVKFGHEFGRSLGYEMCAVTFDFFGGSIGAHTGRYTVKLGQAACNRKPPPEWCDESGHFSVTKLVKSLANEVWRAVTYSGGEDWAAALPYVYYLKAQRSILSKIFPGAEYAFDAMRNSAHLVNDKGHVVGSYSLALNIEGMLAFPTYNFVTSIFRETHNRASKYLISTWNGEKPAEEPKAQEAPRGIFSPIKDLGRYIFTYGMKGYMCTLPASATFFPFWSNKNFAEGMAINPRLGVLAYDGPSGRDLLKANNKATATGYFVHHLGDAVSGKSVSNPFAAPGFQPYAVHSGGGVNLPFGYAVAERFGKPLGKFTSSEGMYGKFVNGTVGKALKWTGMDTGAAADVTKWHAFAFPYANYFAVKSGVLGQMWGDNNHQIDVSLGMTFDGFVEGDLAKLKKGLSYTWNSLTRRPLPDADAQMEVEQYRQSHPKDRSPEAQWVNTPRSTVTVNTATAASPTPPATSPDDAAPAVQETPPVPGAKWADTQKMAKNAARQADQFKPTELTSLKKPYIADPAMPGDTSVPRNNWQAIAKGDNPIDQGFLQQQQRRTQQLDAAVPAGYTLH